MEEKKLVEEQIEKKGKTETEILEEKKEKLIDFLKKRINWVCYILLIFLVYINVKIRLSPLPRLKDITTNSWTLGPDLDPFLFLRYAKNIVENGSLAKIDIMRYVPLGYNTAGETKLLPYAIAYLYKFLSFFSETTLEYAAIIFPVVFSVFTAIFFFLFVKKIFEDKGKTSSIIALIATAFLIVLPSLIPRTIAGIPEKESMGFTFLFAAFYFFLCAWKSENFKYATIFAILAGLFTGLMGAVWGAWIFIFITIAISVFLAFMFNKIDKKRAFSYFLWFIISVALPILFFKRYKLIGLLVSTSTGLATAVFLLILIDLLIFNTQIKTLFFIEKLRKKIPDRIISLLFTIIIVIIFSSAFIGISFIPNSFSHVTEQLISPYTERHPLTVAENRQPYFNEWEGSFGPYIKGIALFFWLFFIGSVYLFYEMSTARKKDKLFLTAVYTIFLFCLIFSRYSQASIFNGTNNISKITYFGGIFLLIFSFVYFYYKNNELELFEKINFGYIVLFILFFISLIGARSAIRLIMNLAPVGAIIVSYFVVSITVKALENKKELEKVIIFTIAIVVILATSYSLYFYYQVTSSTAPNYVPSGYNIQWQKAMAWVRNNTEKEAVFGHWWDYGYWLQSIGERATMLDGGNAIGYWNYLMGRHVLTAESEEEALEVLYSHNVTHFLIDSTEIGKYSAYSSIGSDENYDRLSWIGTFVLNEQATTETKNEISYFYQGGIGLDEDFLYETEGQQILFPAKAAGVGALILKLTKEENETLKQPEAVFVYQGRQVNVPLRYLYYNKLYDFGKGYEGAVYIFPKIVPQNGGVTFNEKGAALFLSERNMRALWVRLYLLGEGKNFELVYNEPSLLIENLKNQGLSIGDFVLYQGGTYGPIKIWKINYTGKEKINPEYLQTTFPEKIKQRAFA